MSSSIPQWLNNSFFEKVLRTSHGDKNLTISEVSVASAGSSKEQYASTIFKATVKYANKFATNNTAKLLIKLVVPKANAFSDENSFDTELNVYLNTLPDIQRLLAQTDEKVELAPRLFYSAKEPVPVLVFEDATVHGYGLSSGLLNIEGTKFVAAKLAKFHAASLYLDRDGKEVSYYKNGLFNLKSRDGINFMKNNFYLFIDESRSWSDFDTIREKLESIASMFDALGGEVYQPNASNNGYNVLNHGDFHFNNMLFKKNSEGKISDVIFVDFQMSKWGSPSIDLLYLLYMVASQETREQYRSEIIRHYYAEFCKTLKQIGYMPKPPALLDLNIELLKNGFLELVIAVCFVPFFYLDQASDYDVAYENGIEGINLRRNLYKNPEYQKFATKVLTKFLYNGLLN